MLLIILFTLYNPALPLHPYTAAVIDKFSST
jgi:hypothetical protein